MDNLCVSHSLPLSTNQQPMDFCSSQSNVHNYKNPNQFKQRVALAFDSIKKKQQQKQFEILTVQGRVCVQYSFVHLILLAVHNLSN